MTRVHLSTKVLKVRPLKANGRFTFHGQVIELAEGNVIWTCTHRHNRPRSAQICAQAQLEAMQ